MRDADGSSGQDRHSGVAVRPEIAFFIPSRALWICGSMPIQDTLERRSIALLGLLRAGGRPSVFGSGHGVPVTASENELISSDPYALRNVAAASAAFPQNWGQRLLQL